MKYVKRGKALDRYKREKREMARGNARTLGLGDDKMRNALGKS